MINIMSKRKSIIIELVILALLVTVPAFIPNHIPLSWDATMHMSRFTQIADSLKHFQLPSMISLYGSNNNLNATVGMYPWLSELYIIIPMIFLKPMEAVAIGFLLLNLLTTINIYLLVKQLTTNRAYQLLGISLYIFNGYHLISLYAKLDMGEATAYAFFPLLILGLIKVWHADYKKGIITEAVAFAGIANSHLLSLFFSVVILVIFEIYRLIVRKFSVNELKAFVVTAVASILASLYSLCQIGYLLLNNKLFTPQKSWLEVSLFDSFNDLVRNQFHITYTAWNLGLGTSLISLLLLMDIFCSRSKLSRSNKYTLAAFISLLFIYDYLPISKLMGGEN